MWKYELLDKYKNETIAAIYKDGQIKTYRLVQESKLSIHPVWSRSDLDSFITYLNGRQQHER